MEGSFSSLKIYVAYNGHRFDIATEKLPGQYSEKVGEPLGNSSYTNRIYLMVDSVEMLAVSSSD